MMFRPTALAILYLASVAATASINFRNDVLYTLANDPNGASIMALELSKNGTIMSNQLTSTGGNGSSGTTAPGAPAVGSLFSAGSVVVSSNYLFTVNPGSNTLSMFSISPSSPMNPKLIGTPADTLGDFPVSIAYSPQINTACVLNGGATSGVTCFSVDATRGLKAIDSQPRSLAQALNQTTPPKGPFGTASQISFTPSGSALVASIKGDPTTKKQGYLYAWPVKGGKVQNTPVISQPKGTFVDFSISFLGNDFEFLVSDPALGAVIIGVGSDLSMSTLAPVNVTYQKAICWSYYVPKLDTVFLIDTAQGNITSISSQDGTITSTIEYKGDGLIDPVVVGSSLYSVDQNNSIYNFNIAGFGSGKAAELVQIYNPTLPKNATSIKALLVGMDVFRSSDYYYR